MSDGRFAYLMICNLGAGAFVQFGLYGAAAIWLGAMVIFMADAICLAIKGGRS